MCLLDAVLSWDADEHRMHCLQPSRDPTIRWRAEGRLDAVCGVEYAAQAMAVHGGLTAAGSRPAAGYLASVRDVICHRHRLDLLPGDLLVTATRLAGERGDRAVYVQPALRRGGRC